MSPLTLNVCWGGVWGSRESGLSFSPAGRCIWASLCSLGIVSVMKGGLPSAASSTCASSFVQLLMIGEHSAKAFPVNKEWTKDMNWILFIVFLVLATMCVISGTCNNEYSINDSWESETCKTSVWCIQRSYETKERNIAIAVRAYKPLNAYLMLLAYKKSKAKQASKQKNPNIA